jgi:hypothetical protein
MCESHIHVDFCAEKNPGVSTSNYNRLISTPLELAMLISMNRTRFYILINSLKSRLLRAYVWIFLQVFSFIWNEVD